MLQSCQRKWKCEHLQKDFDGTIVFFKRPVVVCGVVSTASVAFIYNGPLSRQGFLRNCRAVKSSMARELHYILCAYITK